MKQKTNRIQWPQAAKLALSIVINVEEGAEYSVADGDPIAEPVDELQVSLKKPIRNYGNESNYRYGIIEGAPRVLKLLEKYQINPTFTAAAVALERAPELAAAIKAKGYEVCSHGYRWVHQFRMNEAEEREFIRKAVASIEATTGAKPVGWLSRYLLTKNTRRLLIEEGFAYHMDDYSRDEPFWAEEKETSRPIVVLPYAMDSNDMKMWIAPSLTPKQWLEYAIDTFDCLYAEGDEQTRMMSLGLHLRIIGRPGRIGALEAFLKYVREKPGVWIANRADIAKVFAQQNPAPNKAREKEVLTPA